MSSNVQDLYPLTPLQQGMLFHVLYAPEADLYVDHIHYTLKGALDEAAFRQAWQQVIARHDVLRSAFVWEDVKQPLQIVLKQIELPLTVHDLRGSAPDEQQHQIDALLETVRGRGVESGFNLAKPPLLRLVLIQTDEQSYEFIWDVHHILIDGWSVSILLGELMTFYELYSRQQEVTLPKARPYKAYIAWLQKQDMDQAEAFWRKTMAGISAPTSLDFGFGPTGQNGDSARTSDSEQNRYLQRQCSLSEAVTSDLNAVARQHRLTLNTLVQGAWALLLHRYSSENNVVFGTVVSGRPADMAGAESMVGLFINTLPVRASIAQDAQLLLWLEAFQTQQFEARQYEYSSLIDIHGWSDVPRNQPLFESIVVFENQSSGSPNSDQSGSHNNAQSGASLQIQTSQHSASHTGYPLTVVVEPKADLAITLYYDSHRFDVATIDRTLGHLQTLLNGMACGLEKKIGELPILTQREEELLLRKWSNTATDYPHDRSVAQLFEEQAARTPDAIAIEFGDRMLTYCALNERANQLAHFLRAEGIETGAFVGICMERSPEIVIGILGILKAGAAYLPLDPTYPAERLSVMIEDAQPQMLLSIANTQAKLTVATRERVNVQSRIVNLSDAEKITDQPTSNPSITVSGDYLAYVMYTSGSTGKPKGITIPHRAINRLVFNSNYMDFEPGLRFGMISNTAFDAATFELWGALLHGGCLVGIPREVALSPAEFAEFIRVHRIDTMFLTTALFNQMAREIPTAFGTMRHLLFGGESVDPSAVHTVLANDPPERLIHVYGPTESTTFATWYRIDDVAKYGMNIPIGYPLSNTQTYVLNGSMQPVPVGGIGELYIGGDGLAYSYLNLPALTAANFVPNPFSQNPSVRLYKTGDLVRYLPDGAIEFVGRVDHQVKIRGFRIELTEIETVLAQHPAVQQALVAVDEVVVEGDAEASNATDKRIVAYVVPRKPDSVPSVADLRAHLQATLPDYMTPSTFITLDALPLTPNGKIDRKALPKPDQATLKKLASNQSDAYVGPRTPTEEMVAAIWAKVLGRSQIDILEDFFLMGGHSLLATQVVSRLKESFQAEVPLRLLFENSTVASIAPHIDAIIQRAQGMDLPVMLPADRSQRLPLSFAQQRLWFIDQIEPGNPAYNMPSAMRLTGALDVPILEESINTIVARHESLRTTFAAEHGAPYQVVHPFQPLKLEVESLTNLDGKIQEERLLPLAAKEAATPFDLNQGPLFRVRLLRLANHDYVILVNMHHIVSDEWSLGVLVQEMAALYSAFSHGKPSPLPELPVQYPDFAAWQRNHLQGEVLENQLAYWRQTLGGNLPIMQLPYDRPRPAAPTYTGAIHSFHLSAEVSQGIQRLSQNEGVTLFMTLLAGLQTLLYRTTGQADVVVGTDVANRNRLETEGLIGFFVNHLVLRSDLSGNPSFQALLKQVRTTTLGAYAHQDLPFDRLVSELQPERTDSHTPLFQVLFVLGNPTAPTLELPGLTFSPLKSDLILSKYDLTLFMGEREDGIGGAWRYSTECFDSGTIHQLSQRFTTLLSSIVTNPSQGIDRIALLTAAEEAQKQEEQTTRQETRAQGRKKSRRKATVLES